MPTTGRVDVQAFLDDHPFSAFQWLIFALGFSIVLLDGSELARLMIEHDIGVRTVQTIKIQKIDLEAYEEEAA